MQRAPTPVSPASDEDLWTLYALSRVNDLLLLGFQPLAPGRIRRSWTLSPDDFAGFVMSIGLQVVREASFSPFFHEIVTVEQDADDKTAPTVAGEYWPAVMLGDLMIARAGVMLRSGRRFVRKDIAESSCLYWAYRRNNRQTYDLSVGWGSNSQWRTSFRRDYRFGSGFRFNVDGVHDLAKQPSEPDRDELPLHARRELLLHRCFITHPDPAERCFPFDDTWSLSAAELAYPYGCPSGPNISAEA